MSRGRRTAAVGIAVGIALLVVVGAGVAGADSDRQTDRTTSLQDAGATVQGDAPPTLEGDVTTEPVYAGEYLVAGTSRGVYVFGDGTLEHHVESRPVDRIVRVDDGTVVALVDADHFPNVLGIDLETGDVRWSTGRERGVYSRDLGHVDRQVPAFDAVPVGDVSGDGTADVAVAAGSAVLAVDGASGDRLWTVDYRRNVWGLETDGDRVYAATQSGSLLAVDADDGERVYDEQVVEPFDHEDVGIGTVSRSLWDVERLSVGGLDRLVVTGEGGTVSLVDPDDGEVGWQRQVAEFDEGDLSQYYQRGASLGDPETVPGDSHFRNLEATVVGGDSPAVAVTVAVDGQAARRGFDDDYAEVHVLDAGTGQVRWSDGDLNVDSADSLVHHEGIEDGALVYATAPSDGIQTLRALDPADGEVLAEDGIPVFPGVRRYGPTLGTGYVATDGEDLAVTATNGGLQVLNPETGIDWWFPTQRDVETTGADFTGDGVEDVLVTSRHHLQEGIHTTTLVVRSGVDGSTVWSTTVSPLSAAQEGAYQRVRTVETGDGVDVVAARVPPAHGADPDELPPSAIVRFDGETGERVLRTELVNEDGEFHQAGEGQQFRPGSFDAIGDVTGDGEPNAIVGFWGRVAVLDLATGDVVWQRSYDEPHPQSEARQWRPVGGDDIRYRSVGEADDGTERIVAISRGQGEIAVLVPEGSGEELSFRTVHEASFDGQLVARFDQRRLGDLDGDGLDELLIPIRGDEPRSAVFSPGAGESLAELPDFNRLTLRGSDGDGTGDDRGSVVAFTDDGEDSELAVYAGTERVWSRDVETIYRLAALRFEADLLAAAPAGDVDGDGAEEIAHVESSDQGGARVQFHDARTDEVVDTVVLSDWEEVDDEPIPGLSVQRIPDVTGDGQPELGAVAVTTGDARRGAEFFVVDPTAGEVLISGEGLVAEFLALEEGVGLVRSDGSLRTVDVHAGIELDQPEPRSDLELSWGFDTVGEYVTTVTVDDRPVAMTTDRSTSLRLPGGTHEITVRSTDRRGITVHDSTTVTVDESSSSDLLLYGASGASMALLFAIGLVPALIGRVRR